MTLAKTQRAQRKAKTEELLKNCGVLDLSKLTKNSVLVIRGQNHSAVNVESIMKYLKPHLPKGILIWLAQEGETLEAITEEEMNRLGWYKKNILPRRHEGTKKSEP